MKNNSENLKTAKIREEFRARLNRMEPQQKVRAIVVLRNADAKITPGRRQSPAERQAAIEAMHKSAEPALVEIDNVLKHFGGKRLAPSINTLGAVPVETTVDGITALATLETVRTILEDQPISLLPDPPTRSGSE